MSSASYTFPDSEPWVELPDERNVQNALFEGGEWWEDAWRGMPEFDQKNLTPRGSVRVEFGNPPAKHLSDFEKLIDQKVPNYSKRTSSVWYPEAEIGHFANKRYVNASGDRINPRYPVYIISKGRWESRLTSKALERMNVPYHIVVEPQERDRYAAVIAPEKILVLPFSNLGQGSIPARNWVWEHAISTGAARHWILDDNMDGFFRLNRNLKTPVADGTIFRASEDFVDRYENVAISGFHYFMFASRKSKMPPFTMNSRVYSCILLKNDLGLRWRGRYNEDTDLSIRALKEGWVTFLFLAFLTFKATTMTMKGGNTEELYQKSTAKEDDGRWKMAESLRLQHPELVKITKKWGRWQHSVDYSGFERNKPIRRADSIHADGVDNYGMVLHVDGAAEEVDS